MDDIYFLAYPGEIEHLVQNGYIGNINILVKVGGFREPMEYAMKSLSINDVKKTYISDELHWFKIEIIWDKNLSRFQEHLLNKAKLIMDDLNCRQKIFDIVSINRMKSICQIDLEKRRIISSRSEETSQIPPMVQVRVKTKYLKEMAVHLLQIIKGYAPEYAIPVDFGYMLYEITKEDQERSE